MRTYDQVVSNRKSDNTQEDFVNSFIEKYFFNKLFGTDYERVYDKKRQCDGIDFIVNDNNADVKAQSSKRYINNPRDTFLLEIISYDRNGNNMTGWFINENLKTDYYIFVWIPTADVDISGKLSSSESIQCAEIMIVDKQNLKSYVNSFVTDSAMVETANMMRNTSIHRINVSKEIHFTYTDTLFEKPVNLIVSKNILKRFSTLHCMVKKDSIEKI